MSKKSTRADLACQALRQAIIEQALPPGTKLPEDELGKRFAMSRTLVRAALAQLQSEGLVDAPPRPRQSPRWRKPEKCSRFGVCSNATSSGW
jgi:DNA-binding GntR family transcriptional regulator